MDRKWQYAYIAAPLVVVVGAVWFLRGRTDGGAATNLCTSAPHAPSELAHSLMQEAPGAPAHVRLDWRPAEEGQAATLFVVEAGSTAGALNVGNFIAEAPSYSTDAPPGTYYVRVRAQNACGSSDPSNEIVVTVQ